MLDENVVVAYQLAAAWDIHYVAVEQRSSGRPKLAVVQVACSSGASGGSAGFPVGLVVEEGVGELVLLETRQCFGHRHHSHCR